MILLICAPIAGLAILEAAPALAIVSSKASAEAGLIRIGAQIARRKYGGTLVAASVTNILQNGGDISKLDAFDIASGTLSPTNSLSGIITIAGINSMVDYNPFMKSESGSALSTLGAGKNVFQVGFDLALTFLEKGLSIQWVQWVEPALWQICLRM